MEGKGPPSWMVIVTNTENAAWIRQCGKSLTSISQQPSDVVTRVTTMLQTGKLMLRDVQFPAQGQGTNG